MCLRVVLSCAVDFTDEDNGGELRSLLCYVCC